MLRVLDASEAVIRCLWSSDHSLYDPDITPGSGTGHCAYVKMFALIKAVSYSAVSYFVFLLDLELEQSQARALPCQLENLMQ